MPRRSGSSSRVSSWTRTLPSAPPTPSSTTARRARQSRAMWAICPGAAVP
ncbi:hypothetical protein NKH77_44810 [Streptomyces sp. M19]